MSSFSDNWRRITGLQTVPIGNFNSISTVEPVMQFRTISFGDRMQRYTSCQGTFFQLFIQYVQLDALVVKAAVCSIYSYSLCSLICVFGASWTSVILLVLENFHLIAYNLNQVSVSEQVPRISCWDSLSCRPHLREQTRSLDVLSSLRSAGTSTHLVWHAFWKVCSSKCTLIYCSGELQWSG